jgi:hypothetical protein
MWPWRSGVCVACAVGIFCLLRFVSQQDNSYGLWLRSNWVVFSVEFIAGFVSNRDRSIHGFFLGNQRKYKCMVGIFTFPN